MRLLAAVLGVWLSHGTALAADPVDLNTAAVGQLQELPGIGPKKAAAIVALRQRRPFTRVTQLLEVRGIGKKTLLRLKPLVTVGQGRTQGTEGASSSPARLGPGTSVAAPEPRGSGTALVPLLVSPAALPTAARPGGPAANP